MSKIPVLLVLLVVGCQTAAQEVTKNAEQADAQQAAKDAAPEGYELVWSDEFDGEEIDTDVWLYRADAKHRSVQLRENVKLEDGALVLTLKTLDQPIRKKRNAGAGIITRERFHYGYYEVRARFGDGNDDDNDGKIDEGWHHAFWAMAAEADEQGNVGTTYPDSRRTEIDCYELDDKWAYKEFTQHVIIWKPDGKENGRRPKPPTDHVAPKDFDPNQWHTFAFKWTEDEVTFYVDGEVTVVGKYPAKDYEHDQINLWLTAIAANWCDRDPEASVAYYDYVRAYKPVDAGE